MLSLSSITARAALLLTLAAIAPAGGFTATAVAEPCNPDNNPNCPEPPGDEDNTPPNTTISSGPSAGALIGDATPTFSFTANEGGSTFQCKVDAGAWASCTSPKTTSALSNGAHTFSVKATDDAGNPDPTPASRTFTVDTTDPVVAFTGGLANAARTSDVTPSWTTSATDANGVQRKCKVDAAAYVNCTSSWTAPTQANGAHTVYVKAIDDAGNESAPVSRTFTVDTIAPTAQITGPGLTNDNTPTFTYDAPHDGGGNYTFECTVDAGAPVPCNGGQNAGSFTPATLADGPHTVAVRATDSTGNVQASFATASVTVDTSAPVAVIAAGPADGSTVPPGVSQFQITTADGTATLECQLDGGGFLPCASPFVTPSLGTGPHKFEVRATDPAGNQGPVAARGFTVAKPAAPATQGAKGTGGSAAPGQPGASDAQPGAAAAASGTAAAAAAKKATLKARKCKRRVVRLKSGKKVRRTVCAKKKAKKAKKRRRS